MKDLDVYIEQPCATYEECLSVRRMCPLPMVLDESIDDIGKYYWLEYVTFLCLISEPI